MSKKNRDDQWWHKSFNPWYGCTKISPACDHCFAENMANRFPNTFGGAKWGNHPRVLSSEANWQKLNRPGKIGDN